MYSRFHNFQLLISVCQCGKAISAYYKVLKVSYPLYIFTILGFCTLDCIDRNIDGFKWYFLFWPRLMVCVLVLVFWFSFFNFFSHFIYYTAMLHGFWITQQLLSIHTYICVCIYMYVCVYIHRYINNL